VPIHHGHETATPHLLISSLFPSLDPPPRRPRSYLHGSLARTTADRPFKSAQRSRSWGTDPSGGVFGCGARGDSGERGRERRLAPDARSCKHSGLPVRRAPMLAFSARTRPPGEQCARVAARSLGLRRRARVSPSGLRRHASAPAACRAAHRCPVTARARMHKWLPPRQPRPGTRSAVRAACVRPSAHPRRRHRATGVQGPRGSRPRAPRRPTRLLRRTGRAQLGRGSRTAPLARRADARAGRTRGGARARTRRRVSSHCWASARHRASSVRCR
jgi:hypothetical protein